MRAGPIAALALLCALACKEKTAPSSGSATGSAGASSAGAAAGSSSGSPAGAAAGSSSGSSAASSSGGAAGSAGSAGAGSAAAGTATTEDVGELCANACTEYAVCWEEHHKKDYHQGGWCVSDCKDKDPAERATWIKAVADATAKDKCSSLFK